MLSTDGLAFYKRVMYDKMNSRMKNACHQTTKNYTCANEFFFIRLSIVKIAPCYKLKFTFAFLRPHLIGHN